ncbi:MAG: class II fumarate hydratase [Bdellovibrionales bacterium]|nr:class II fumarate hydratase [Bdellovibrionales bacterium]
MGEMKVPSNAYYGAQTQRAVENFPISQSRLTRSMILALGEIKRACAKVSGKHGWIKKDKSEAIVKAAQEVSEGKWDDQFVVDIFQTGSGTSSNMNTNEVIANRASEIMGEGMGSRVVHPNDDVNYGQSSNDVFPTAMHLAILHDLDQKLLPALVEFEELLQQKAKDFDSIVKIGRTHLQDATPIRMGQVFSGYAAQIQWSVERLQYCIPHLEELALGGTAVGTGINRPEKMTAEVIHEISDRMGFELRETRNHFASQSGKEAVLDISSALKSTAAALMKIANDIRFLGSGPRCGIGELVLPATQPGSSIMPGKVNPVIAESLTMVCAQVIGNDAAVTIGAQSGNFELNVMMPMIIHNVLESISIMASGVKNFHLKCIQHIQVDEKQCKDMIEKSLAMATSLAPILGYDKASAIAKESYQTKRSVREIVVSQGELSQKQIDEALDPMSMTHPNRS